MPPLLEPAKRKVDQRRAGGDGERSTPRQSRLHCSRCRFNAGADDIPAPGGASASPRRCHRSRQAALEAGLRNGAGI